MFSLALILGILATFAAVAAIVGLALKLVGWTLKLTLGLVLMPVLLIAGFAVLFGLGVAVIAVIGVVLGFTAVLALPVLAVGGLAALVARASRG